MALSEAWRVFWVGFRAGSAEVWGEARKGARRGARDALVGFWTPLRPRFWRYVIREARAGGWRAGLRAVDRGMGLMLHHGLDPRGRLR